MKGKFKQKILLYKVKSIEDTESFGQLYDLYIDRIFRFVLFKVSDVEDAKDLTSEVFLKTWKYIKENEKIDNFNALVYQISRNSIIDFYRKTSAQNNISDQGVLERLPDEFSEKLLEEANIKMEMIVVVELLRKLKDEYREVILLRYIEEYSIKEIAKIIEKSQGNVKVTLHRALKRLQSLAQESEAVSKQ